MPTKCIDFLAKERRGEAPAVIVSFGADEFLHRKAYLAVREWTIGPEPDDFTLAIHAGDKAPLRDVLDDLFTRPMLGDRRLVVVEAADPFVTSHRDALLKYVESPSKSAALLLAVKTWRSNTKLAKAVELSGLALETAVPKDWHVPAWCAKWAAAHYDKKLTKPTAEWLVELVGVNLGQLDQEISKLAAFVGVAEEIDAEAVNRLVAGARTESAFKLLDMVFEGQLGKALLLLDRQVVAGDSPVMVLAMLTSQLRKLTVAARGIVNDGLPMARALEESGVPPFAIRKSEDQLRRIGRERMLAMYRRLLRADLDLKGGSGLDQRTVLERFLVEIGRPASTERRVASPS